MNCRVCGHHETHPVPFELPPNEPAFVRCVACCSDSSPLSYGDVKHFYSTEHNVRHRQSGGGADMMRRHCSFNTDWLLRHPNPVRKTFLDVGSCDGSALDNMAAGGWTVQGFDVVPPDFTHHRVTVASEFRAGLFPEPFGAVLCREVIEHVPDPHGLLRELVLATESGGLLEIQTPRPMSEWHPIPYQTPHLQILSPGRLIDMIQGAGLKILDKRIWPQGQAWLCRK